MKKLFVAAALATALAQPASAITFSNLTTIYIGSGVTELDASPGHVATVFSCSNVSGQSANVRYLILDFDGSFRYSDTETLAHGATAVVSTSDVLWMFDLSLASSRITHGVINIESTQSGVFCTAMLLDPTAGVPNGIHLHLVRVNPHPGTVE